MIFSQILYGCRIEWGAQNNDEVLKVEALMVNCIGP